MRALDAPRARKLQPRSRADMLAPTALARSAEPRHALPFSPLRAKQPPPRPAGQALAATAARQPCAVQRRPSLARLPPGPWSSASSSTRVSPSSRRRHVPLQLQNDGSPAALIHRRGTDLGVLYMDTPSPSEHARDLMLPPWRSPASHSTRGGLLPRLRQLLPPPPPRPIRHL